MTPTRTTACSVSWSPRSGATRRSSTTSCRSGTATCRGPPCSWGSTPELARHKVALLNKAFPSQQHRDWWDDELFLGLMRIRGMECRRTHAEAFHAPKLALDLGDEPRADERD